MEVGIIYRADASTGGVSCLGEGEARCSLGRG